VDPSSLIFVVIVGIWAVYLLGHWVRRRDLLATARSVDRFSEAMRVLERRPPQPVPSPPSRSYVVTPARLPAKEVPMREGMSEYSSAPRKTTVAASAAPPRPSVRSDVGAGPREQGPGASRARAERPTPAVAGPGAATRDANARLSGTAPNGGSQASNSRPSGSSRVGTRSARPDAAANRARALVLLALLALTPLTWVLAAVTALPIWLPLVLTVALAVHVLRLRRAAMRRRQAARRRARVAARTSVSSGGNSRTSTRPATRSAGRRAARPAAAPSASAGRPPRDETTSEDAPDRARLNETAPEDPAEQRLREATDRPGSLASARAAGAERPAEADGTASNAQVSAAADTRAAADDTASTEQETATAKGVTATASGETATASGETATASGETATASGETATAADGTTTAVAAGWQPVPVPPPTYTLKPKAPAPVRRSVSAASAAPRGDAPVQQSSGAPSDRPADAPAPGFDLDAILERRIASGG
jgi:hypothetical protein